MGTISKPYTFSPGGVIYSAEINAVLDTVYEAINGNIDDANIKSAAGIAYSKIDFAGSNPFTPSGIIVSYGGAVAPTGWLLCQGQAVSRTTYTNLFAVLGESYGAGDGSTTFNLPNLKGKIAVGYDSTQTEFDALGETGGAKTHTLTVDEMPEHSHPYVRYSSNTAPSGGGEPAYWSGTTSQNTGSAGSGSAHNNLQPYVVTNYIIKI
jgi:microcystin-dependent protein